jgi:hypothetical protein
LCQLCAHREIGSTTIENILLQITLHGEGIAFHEDIGITCFTLQDQLFSLSSSLVDVIEHEIHHQWKMLMTNLHYAKVFFNSHLLVKACLHDNVDAKETFNRVL